MDSALGLSRGRYHPTNRPTAGVRRGMEYLGVTDTQGKPLEHVRILIQQAWANLVAVGGAEGPKPVRPTVGAGLLGARAPSSSCRPGSGVRRSTDDP
jgi:hypothetical protein